MSIMLRKMFLTLMMLGVFGITSVFAHAIWMETAATGQKGVSQEVRIFFGEFATEDISPADKWFSDLNQFKLFLHTPDNKQIELKTTVDGTGYKADFTPELDGVYQLVIRKIAKEVSYGYLLDYTSTAVVRVGAANNLPTSPAVLAVHPKASTYAVNQPIDFTALIDSTLKGDREIVIISPNSWTKKLYPDESSKTSFVPLWPGKYLVEMTVTSKTTGEHNGTSYSVGYHCGTYAFEVK